MWMLFSLLVFLVGEGCAYFIFKKLNGIFLDGDKLIKRAGDVNFKRVAIIKGVLERLTILFGLLAGLPQILIAFGAFKLGTRLHSESDTKISNDYFLIGNLLSLLLVIGYFQAIKQLPF